MPSKIKICLCSGKSNEFKADLPWCAVVRVIEQCCFNSTPDPFNDQTANFISKPPKVIESSTYVKKSQSGVLLKQHCSITLATCTAGQVC